MKIALLFALLFAVAYADHFLCGLNNLLPPSDHDPHFVCVNNTDGLSVSEPVDLPIPAAAGTNIFSPPANESSILTFLATDLFGTFLNGSFTSFTFQVNGGSSVGSAASCEISYDWDGDGTWDRIELYEIFATDPIEATFENWTSSLNATHNITGSFANLVGGSIRVRVWSAFGDAPMSLRVGISSNASIPVCEISFPFTFAQACCAKIDMITTELNDLKTRVDILNSKLLSVSQSCCSATGTSGTSGSTSSGTTAVTATGLSTATATVSGTVTEVGTAASSS